MKWNPLPSGLDSTPSLALTSVPELTTSRSFTPLPPFCVISIVPWFVNP